MSLINKMLQDLDARGTPGAESFPSQIRPVAPARAGLADRVDARTLSLAVAGVSAVCAAVALAWFGWGQLQKSGAAKPVAVAAAPAPIRPAAELKPAQGMSSTITTTPMAASVPVPAAVPAAAPAVEAPAVVAPAPARAAPADERFDAPAAAKPGKPAAPASKSVAGYEPDSEEARAARQAIMAELQSRMRPAGASPGAAAHESKRAAKRAKPAAEREQKTGARAKAGAAQGREDAAPQRAEGEYRRALASLQDGRMSEAVAALEQALRIDPAHDAARQTLVGLLIEAKRSDEAIRHLQAGLALDARQPALAMLLARLQIERGGSGIDTLMRTLPYAGSNADYHAFLAGALQREQRHREAAEQYQAALRAAPGNGVWWMGLGMSLQAEKRNSEALEAFQRARASASLSAELLAFVERRLQQLGR
jgi:MSHA biogenesis protein MshN